MNAIYGSLAHPSKSADLRRPASAVPHGVARWLPLAIAALAVTLTVWTAHLDMAAATSSASPPAIAAV